MFPPFVWWLAIAATAFALAAGSGIAKAAPAEVDAIVVKWRSDAKLDDGGALSAADRDSLLTALQTPFSIVEPTRTGALRLQLLQPLPLEAARAAVNRVRMLHEVVYANIDRAAAGPARSIASAGQSVAAANDAATPQPPITRYIVKYRDPERTNAAKRGEPLPTAAVQQLSTLAEQPAAHERAMSGGAYVVRLFHLLSVDQARAVARKLERDAAIEYVEPDILLQPALVPNDTLFATQWHYLSPPTEMGGVNLPPAWDVTTGNASVVAAVIDTGSLPGHPDLAGRDIGGYDFIGDVQVANDGNGRDGDPSDPGDWVSAPEVAAGQYFYGCPVRGSLFHGAHVAGTIGAASNNGVGVAGINWVSKILHLRALGKCGGSLSDIVDAIRWAAGLAVPGVPQNANPAWVMNLSLGGNGGCDDATQSAVDDAVSAGAVVVVAAGNGNRSAAEYVPGSCDGVLTVGATGRQGQRASYSNYGPLVEISAPGGSDGENVRSTRNFSTTSPDPMQYGYGGYVGTSMATPHVTGIVSLMLSRNPSLTPAQVMSILQTTARAFPTGTVRDCTTALCGAGIIDAAAAVLAAGGASATTTTVTTSGTPALLGSTVTFTATVTGTNPTGSVGFTDNGSPIATCTAVALTGSGNARTAACPTASLALGPHSIVASYGGNAGNLASVSPALTQNIDPVPAGSTNVALAANGGLATASSSTAGRSPASLNDDERAGINWSSAGYGGVWRDGTVGVFPDWVQINFNGTKTIDRVVVYGGQDNYLSPLEPTDSMTCTQYCLADYVVQGWVGGNWIPLATVTGNTLVKRTSTFTATATDQIRIHVTNALNSYTRMSEVEAWATGAPAGPAPSTTTVTTSGTPALLGSTVTFTATVTGTNPTGSVGFTDNGSPIATCTAVALTGSGNARTAACPTASLALGPHSIVASYGGNAGNLASVSPALTQNIDPVPAGSTKTAVTSSGTPALLGSTVTFTATVTGTNPTGSVGFTDNGSPIATCTAVALTGSGNARTAACPTASLALGPHSIVASYGGNAGNLASVSPALTQNIDPVPAGSTNVALAANGGLATASSSTAGRSPASLNDDERAGINWSSAGYGGVWRDGTVGVFPDWVQINFNGTKTIDRVVVYGGQDNYLSPLEPTDSMTCTQYCLADYVVQGWVGGNWIPLATVTGNTLVKRTSTFTATATDQIRIHVTNALNSYTRMSEVEAWATGAPAGPAPSTTTVTTSGTPALLGSTVTFTATVTGTNPTGSVGFTDNGSPIATCTAVALTGSGNARTAACPTASLTLGPHSIVASYGGNAGNLASVSPALTQNIDPVPAGSTNVALAANGGLATASSSTAGRSPASLNDDERAGINWSSAGYGGVWRDGTVGVFPDWVQINFNGTKTIDRVVVYGGQDNYLSPLEPTDSMTCTQYCLADYVVQGWVGGNWIPLATVTGNTLVKRTSTFTATATDQIRIHVTNALNSYTRMSEVEAWTSGTPVGPPAIALQSVVGGLTNPVDITHAGDGSGRLFVAELRGRIRTVSAGALSPTPFLDISTLVTPGGGEQGLLGVAFHPQYAANGYLFVNYTRVSDGATVIARYQRSATDPNVADASSERILLTIAQPYANHNGGQLRFGPDGYLYIGMGDGGSSNDPQNRAQDLGTLLGKMLRIDVNNASPPYYSIPPGNPFGNEIWAYGLRNPWRFSFDRATGDLFIGDVGQGSWEEIDFQPAGTGAGANYGWRVMEGLHCTGLGGACPNGSVPPILEYGHALGCSVTGGYRYRGAASPSLAGYYLYGDFCSGRIWGAVTATGGSWQTTELKVAGFGISSFGEDQAGEVYVAAYGTGAIYRISAQ